MNARVDIGATQLRVTMSGWAVLWTFRRRLSVPLEHVRGASVDPDVARRGPWLGAGRTDALLDYAVAAGPMLVHGRHEFWDVHHPEKTIAIDLVDEPYERLVLEVSDPAAVVAAVNAAVTSARAAA
jgi:hypothetical protein